VTSIEQLEERVVFDEWARLARSSKRSIERAGLLANALDLDSAVEGITLVGVVGSKGKGTAAIYASATAAAASHKVGTLTSPGIRSNRDRVRINGKVLPDNAYRRLLDTVHAAKATLPAPTTETGYLSPSGLYMLGGLAVLAEEDCDVVVVEAGVGGRSDELSLLGLVIVVVTQIFDEHREILGPTLRDIAVDKIHVVSDHTKHVVCLPQVDPVRTEILKRSTKQHATLHWIGEDSTGVVHQALPHGYGRLNAAAGVTAGALLDDSPADPVALERVLVSVNYPGRLSEHQTHGGLVIVDSAISRNGLAGALSYAHTRFGEPPDLVLVSLPVNKDFAGFVEELSSLGRPRYFVDMPGIHMPYPRREDWPWQWITIEGAPELLPGGNVLAVGTALFSGAILSALGVNTDEVFTT
jgi:dihydrofolate synthase / folylpolyglutamate synthase